MAKPIISSNNKTGNCTPTSSQCVIWEGTLPTCIEACFGDTIEDIVYKIASKVCTIESNDTIPLSMIGCLPIADIDGDFSTKNILRILISEHCILDERVQTLENTTPTSGDTPTHLTVGGTYWNCLQTFTGTFLLSDATDNQIINLILQGVCQTHTELINEIARLESVINGLPTGSGGSSPAVTVTSGCLFSGSKTIGSAWSILDTDYCAFTTKVGTTGAIDGVLVEESVWINDINTELLNPLGLDLIPASLTLAQTVENLWHVVGAMNDKLTAATVALSACCGFSCKKFEVTVNAINFDSANNTVDLRFGFDGSTILPGAPYAFVDTGSTVTFTDSTGFALAAIPITIQTASTYQDLDLTGLDLTGEIQVDVDLQFEVTDSTDPTNIRLFNCTKCLHTYFKTGVACSFCTLRVIIAGDNPEVKITYSVNGQEQTLIITEETGTTAAYKEYVIPSGATITSIINVNNSSVSVTSVDCPNLVIPDIDTLACYSFVIDEDFFDEEGGHSFDYYYTITGIMENGEDIVTYSPGVRCDLTSARGGTCESYTSSDIETSCGFNLIGDSVYSDSFNRLNNIPTNSSVFSISKLCSRVFYDTAPTPDVCKLIYTNIIVRGVSGKNLFLHLTPEPGNTLDINQTVDVYIKGVEIPQGSDCDCCYVYDGS